jgi:hypothetical protein
VQQEGPDHVLEIGKENGVTNLGSML